MTTKAPTISMIVGAQIARRRKAQDWTQFELARRIGTREGNVSAWEQGSRMPRQEWIHALARAFECETHELFQP